MAAPQSIQPHARKVAVDVYGLRRLVSLATEEKSKTLTAITNQEATGLVPTPTFHQTMGGSTRFGCDKGALENKVGTSALLHFYRPHLSVDPTPLLTSALTYRRIQA
ncbi:hypothetical protein EGR_09245 [Echinococcus granulosus]|uniref:Uncharacterized protein n=1 Tax=Echinococcus granulosus TaxID=6210 RepID=W6U452_ECHGR|nr:hypothetical protein EGR_09245 [Echinococcus granulosus]EUB55888.1 hypothetical protein EGR_09245 [Echinococcus granulosus]